MRARSAEIVEEDAMLTETVNALLNEMQLLLQDHEHKELAYVQQKDLRNLAIFENMTVIAVRAPPGTRMEVPDPILTPGAPSFQVYLRSETGPVNFYLVSKAQDVQPTSSSSLTAVVPDVLPLAATTSTAGPYVSTSSMIGASLGGHIGGGGIGGEVPKNAENWVGNMAASSEWIGRRGVDSHEGEGDVFGGSSSTANVSPMAIYPSASSSAPVLATDEDNGGSRKRKRVEDDIAGQVMIGGSAVSSGGQVPSSQIHHHLSHDVGSYTLGQLGIDESGFGDASGGSQQYLNTGQSGLGVSGAGQPFGNPLQYSGGSISLSLGFQPRQESRTSVSASDGWQSTKASRSSQNEETDLLISGTQQSNLSGGGGGEEGLGESQGYAASGGVISRLPN